ncbi:transposase, IS4 family [Rhodovulum sulfidophilum]|uniref:Transposase, IS4 family n=1 Tax=Rhodovulum sulfidophilum TaxID=35806 RepID=A0A0D6AYY8_RHOSU|nr:transposase, IS4 family [Rhodovulum sulfidophilum]
MARPARRLHGPAPSPWPGRAGKLWPEKVRRSGKDRTAGLGREPRRARGDQDLGPILVIEKSVSRQVTFERAEFTYEAEADLYSCPGGKELKQSRRTFGDVRG